MLAIAGLAAMWKWFSRPVEEKESIRSRVSAPTEEGMISEKTTESQSSIESEVKGEENSTVSAEKEYKTPSGSDNVGFSAVIDAEGVIVDTSVRVLANNEISKKRQAAFAEALPLAIKGKKLSELSAIDTVGGSSLTTRAFNESLAELKLQTEEE